MDRAPANHNALITAVLEKRQGVSSNVLRPALDPPLELAPILGIQRPRRFLETRKIAGKRPQKRPGRVDSISESVLGSFRLSG